jgi:polyisoprenoid-binding protein YceI
MTTPAQFTARAAREAGRSPRRHHWWRWILGGVAVLLVLLIGGIAAAITLQPSPAPLALPTGTASTPSGSLNGTWQAGSGSAAGFRIQETALWMSNDVVGRTNTVTGTVVIAGDRVQSASGRIDLTTITVGGKKQSQLATSLNTQRYPDATVTLTQPVPLPAALVAGATVTLRAPAQFTVHGVTRPVTVTLTARRDGTALQAVGTIPVSFGTWGIKGPKGYGPIGSLASHAIAEFRLILSKS